MTERTKPPLRAAFQFLLGAVFVGVLLFAGQRFVLPAMGLSAVDELGRGDYRLMATDGSEFTEASLVGAPSAVFFGFTHCPEVCPTTLGDVAMWTEDLEDGALQVFFVTVDPERDTLDNLEGYVSWIPGVVGVSGASDEVAKAIESFKVVANRVPLDDGDYTMDHSSAVLLFDRKGQFVETVAYQEDFDTAKAKLDRLLGS